MRRSATIKRLRKQVLALEKRVASLSSDRESLLHIATEALRALALQRPDLQPEGFCIRAQDKTWMDHISELSTSTVPLAEQPGQSWEWHQVREVSKQTQIPVYAATAPPSPSAPKVYKVQPFQQSFPLELFGAIISLADTQAISRTAQASSACYQLFMPLLYDHLEVTNKKKMVQIFASDGKLKFLPRPLRLCNSQPYQWLQSLLLSTSSLRGSDLPEFVDVGRFSPHSPTIDLDTLTISIDEKDTSTWLQYTSFKILPSSSRRILAHLNPSTLVVRVDRHLGRELKPGSSPSSFGVHKEYVISEEAAAACSSWDRLKLVYLRNVNVVTSTAEGDEDAPTAFFFGAANDKPIASFNVKVVWDLSGWKGLPYYGAPNILHLLLHRDAVLRQPWLGSFTAILADREACKRFQQLVDAADDVPSCLKWEERSSQGEKRLYA